MHSTHFLSQSVCARQLKILADPTRLAVLTILMEEPKQVRELNAYLGLEQSLLSHHLQVLRQAGFVEATRQGKSVLYAIAPGIVSSSERTLNLGCCLLSFAPNP